MAGRPLGEQEAIVRESRSSSEPCRVPAMGVAFYAATLLLSAACLLNAWRGVKGGEA